MILNASSLPKVYYGLHMVPGVAEYNTPAFKGRLFIGEEAIKNMDPSYKGKPVYVRHVDEIDLPNLQTEADGYVIRSFYNKSDGKHWAEFIVVSDKGHEAIAKKWKLSNAYQTKEMAGGGQWHSVEFQKEVIKGEYEHLAIVPDPRYEESIILTPEEFKAYNSEKESELQRLANSKETVSMFNIFKKTKVENSSDYESLSVTLPKSKIDMTLTQLVTEMDVIKNMNGYASGDHMVKINDKEEMSVSQLAKKYNAMMMMEKEKAEKAENEDDEMAGEKAENEAEVPKEEAAAEKDEAKKNEDDDKKKKEEEMKSSKKNSKDDKHFEALKNARDKASDESKFVDTSMDQLSRGKSRYGSKV